MAGRRPVRRRRLERRQLYHLGRGIGRRGHSLGAARGRVLPAARERRA